MEKEIITSLTEYNLWSTKEMTRWLAQCDEVLLYKSVESSFDTIIKTIQHMTLAQSFWLTHIVNGNPTDFDWNFKTQSKEETFSDLISSSEQMFEVAKKEQAAFFVEKIQLNQQWLKNELPRYKYLIHVINHSTYHRGQIVTMARNLGINKNIPSTDYNFFNSMSNS